MSRAAGRRLPVRVDICAFQAFCVIAIKRVLGIEPPELQVWFAWTALPVLLPDARR